MMWWENTKGSVIAIRLVCDNNEGGFCSLKALIVAGLTSWFQVKEMGYGIKVRGQYTRRERNGA